MLLISVFKGRWRFSLVVSYGLVGLKCLISLQCDIKALVLLMIYVYFGFINPSSLSVIHLKYQNRRHYFPAANTWYI